MASARPRDWVTARLQVSAPGQATTSRASSAPGSAMPRSVEAGEERGQLVLGEVAEHEVLAVGDPDLEAELAGDRGEAAELGAGDVAEAGPGVGGHGALGDAPHDVGLLPAVVGLGGAERHRRALPDGGGGDAGGEAGRLVAVLLHHLGDAAGPAGRGQQEGAGLEHAALDLVEAELVDDPLQAGPQLVVAVAGLLEDPQDRLEGGEEVLLGGELLEGQRGVGVGAEAAGDEDPEALLDGAVLEGAAGGDDADVVEHGLAAVGLAAREVDLELAGQALGERVVEEVVERGLGPRADVEGLVGAGAGEVAAHDVADGVAAGLAGGEPDRRHVADDGGDLLELHEVELEVLAGGDVAPAPRVGVGDARRTCRAARARRCRRAASPAPSGCGRPGAGRRCRC